MQKFIENMVGPQGEIRNVCGISEQQVPFPRRPKPYCVVIDVGGKTSRVGLIKPSGELEWAESYDTIQY